MLELATPSLGVAKLTCRWPDRKLHAFLTIEWIDIFFRQNL